MSERPHEWGIFDFCERCGIAACDFVETKALCPYPPDSNVRSTANERAAKFFQPIVDGVMQRLTEDKP